MDFFEEKTCFYYPFLIQVPNCLLFILFVTLHLTLFGPWCRAVFPADPSLLWLQGSIREVGKEGISARNLALQEQNPTTREPKRGLVLRSQPLENPLQS